MSMKITSINAREDKAGKHNDRNFDLDYAPHIDQSRVDENLYWTYNGDTEHSFAEIERDFYRQHFEEYLKQQNTKHNSARHYERCKSVDDYLRGKYTRPEDRILQIGNMDEHATKEELWECAMEYVRRFDIIYGEHCKILDVALHMDEATPHVHIRRVWMAEDEQGLAHVNQTKALEQMGITDNDPSRPNGKKNNAKISFTHTDRKLFEQICIDRGLDISKAPPERRKHLTTEEYKLRMVRKDITEAREELERIKSETKTILKDAQQGKTELEKASSILFNAMIKNPQFVDLFAEELLEIKKKERSKRLVLLLELQTKYMKEIFQSDNVMESLYQAKFSHEVEKAAEALRQAEHFIEEHGLKKEYDRTIKEEEKGADKEARPDNRTKKKR